MGKTNFKTVNDYIASKPNEVRLILERLRATIRKVIPAAQEAIAYEIPVYKVNDVQLLFFAGWKQHYSLYPVNDALLAAFRDELARYEVSKGSIRFPLAEPVPVNLIARIAKFRMKQLTLVKGRKTQLDRVRRICGTMPSVSEKLSHGAPTFFVEKDKGVFTVFANDHHSDGHLAVWMPVPPGLQSALIDDAPEVYFKPPYVGASGWIGIKLGQISDDALEIHVRKAWELAAGKKKKPRQGNARAVKSLRRA